MNSTVFYTYSYSAGYWSWRFLSRKFQVVEHIFEKSWAGWAFLWQKIQFIPPQMRILVLLNMIWYEWLISRKSLERKPPSKNASSVIFSLLGWVFITTNDIDSATSVWFNFKMQLTIYWVATKWTGVVKFMSWFAEHYCLKKDSFVSS